MQSIVEKIRMNKKEILFFFLFLIASSLIIPFVFQLGIYIGSISRYLFVIIQNIACHM